MDSQDLSDPAVRQAITDAAVRSARQLLLWIVLGAAAVGILGWPVALAIGWR